MKKLMDYGFASDTAHLARVREQVRNTLLACGCSNDFTETSILAVDEAVSNVMRHGYQAGEPGELRLTISMDDGQLVFVLRDFAERFDSSALSIPAPGELRAGGYGRFLIHELMDSVSYTAPASGQGNLLEMRRRIQPTHPDQ